MKKKTIIPDNLLPTRAGFLLIGLNLMFCLSCEIINPPEQIPAYLRIETFVLNTQGNEGSNSHKITDAWIYVGGEFLGAYPLPATVPVLQAGEQELIIDPGIKDNGIEALPEIYPYYQRFRTTLNLKEGQTETIRPQTRYKENLTFALREEFETVFHSLSDDFDENEATSVSYDTGEAFEGSGSGRIVLTAANPTIEVASNIRLRTLPTDGSAQVYLEMDYKTDTKLDIGLRGYNTNGIGATSYSRGVNAKRSWNKVYINLTDPLIDSQLDSYQLMFRANFPSGEQGFNQSEAIILLDNLKIIHRR